MDIHIIIYIYHIVDTTDRYLLRTSFFGAVIFLRWWLNINHRTRPTCSQSNDFERVVSKSQVLFVWMECIINTWLHPTIAKRLPGRVRIQALTPVWKSEVYLQQLVDVHFKNDDQLGFWSDECSNFNVFWRPDWPTWRNSRFPSGLQSGPKDGPKLAAKEDKHLTRFSRRVAKTKF